MLTVARRVRPVRAPQVHAIQVLTRLDGSRTADAPVDHTSCQRIAVSSSIIRSESVAGMVGKAQAKAVWSRRACLRPTPSRAAGRAFGHPRHLVRQRVCSLSESHRVASPSPSFFVERLSYQALLRRDLTNKLTSGSVRTAATKSSIVFDRAKVKSQIAGTFPQMRGRAPAQARRRSSSVLGGPLVVRLSSSRQASLQNGKSSLAPLLGPLQHTIRLSLSNGSLVDPPAAAMPLVVRHAGSRGRPYFGEAGFGVDLELGGASVTAAPLCRWGPAGFRRDVVLGGGAGRGVEKARAPELRLLPLDLGPFALVAAAGRSAGRRLRPGLTPGVAQPPRWQACSSRSASRCINRGAPKVASARLLGLLLSCSVALLQWPLKSRFDSVAPCTDLLVVLRASVVHV